MPLSAERNTKRRNGDGVGRPAKTNKIFYKGAIVTVGADGYATPGAVATTLKRPARVAETVDTTGIADGVLSVQFEHGVFRYNNSTAGDLIAIADVGNDCFIVDDETVAKTNGSSTRSVAGKIFDVDAEGVWVDMR